MTHPKGPRDPNQLLARSKRRPTRQPVRATYRLVQGGTLAARWRPDAAVRLITGVHPLNSFGM